jgi:hypothetical protein
MSAGVYDGPGREWSTDGRITMVTRHAEGILLKRWEPDDKGDLHVTYELTPDKLSYKRLQRRIGSERLQRELDDPVWSKY